VSTRYAAYGDTFPVRRELDAAGGRYDRRRRQWIFHRDPGPPPLGVAFAPDPLPAGWAVLDDAPPGLTPGATWAGRVVLVQWQGKRRRQGVWVDCTMTLARPLTDSE